MATCANCARELQPAWKYCIYCGARTATALSAATSPEPAPSAPAAPLAPRLTPAAAASTAVQVGSTAVAVAERPETPARAVAPVRAEKKPKINVLAVIALVLACLLSPLAALFGHIALGQLRNSGERGLLPAWIATVLGWVWIAALLVLSVAYIVVSRG